jgi:hypothetical protein
MASLAFGISHHAAVAARGGVGVGMRRRGFSLGLLTNAMLVCRLASPFTATAAAARLLSTPAPVASASIAAPEAHHVAVNARGGVVKVGMRRQGFGLGLQTEATQVRRLASPSPLPPRWRGCSPHPCRKPPQAAAEVEAQRGGHAREATATAHLLEAESSGGATAVSR